jgi:membrane protease YdiL (CAAX protease family)
MKMELKGFFSERPVFNKFLIVIGVVLLCSGIFTFLGAWITSSLYGVDMLTDPSILNNLDDPVVLASLRILQLLSTGLGMFLIPSLIIAFVFSRTPLKYLSLNGRTDGVIAVLVIFLMLISVPFINVLISLNEALVLPEFMSGIEKWMKESEASAMALTDAFLDMRTGSDLLMNLLIMAVVPAIGEELMFRGVLQGLFRELTGNIHAAVILAAVLFSAFHMQFYGFIPRMMLGMVFGYLLIWTGNMWLPILAHFINNGAAVVLMWFASQQQLPFDQDHIGTGDGEWKLALVSAVLLIMVLAVIRRRSLLTGDGVSGQGTTL